MDILNVDSWIKFQEAIDVVRNKYGVHVFQSGEGESQRKNLIMFRGQSNSDWNLLTTLERASDSLCSVTQYTQLACSVSHEIESFVGSDWKIANYVELEKEIKSKQESTQVYLPCYDYLAYLR